jgi:hypothetical protein
MQIAPMPWNMFEEPAGAQTCVLSSPELRPVHFRDEASTMSGCATLPLAALTSTRSTMCRRDLSALPALSL